MCTAGNKTKLACCIHVSPPNVNSESPLFRVNWVNINGTLYKKPCILVLKMEDYPVFGKLLDIFKYNSSVYFHVKVLKTESFDQHFHCFILEPSTSMLCIDQTELFSFVPLHPRIVPGMSPTLCLVPPHLFTNN